jgi:hypothetical protein
MTAKFCESKQTASNRQGQVHQSCRSALDFDGVAVAYQLRPPSKLRSQR